MIWLCLYTPLEKVVMNFIIICLIGKGIYFTALGE